MNAPISVFDALAAQRLTALLQLASPALPVGAYSYSQGLEMAVEDGRVRTESDALKWISDVLTLIVARYEAPVWCRLYLAAERDDMQEFERWNHDFLMTRESAELRAEALQMGYSLTGLLRSLDEVPPWDFDAVAFCSAHAWACMNWRTGLQAGLTAYLFSWVENQVMAALKTVPLGQVAGQRMLVALRPVVAFAAQTATQLKDEDLSTQAPLFAITSAQHEMQYSRLFRS